jgi:sugar phosphate isomerase/epimerase
MNTYSRYFITGLLINISILSSCYIKNSTLLPDPGAVSYTFRTQFQQDVPGTLDLIKEMGITNIEFSNLFGKTAQELKSMLDERGMICTSYGVGYGRIVDEIDEVAQEAKSLGAKYVRVASIPFEPPEFTIEDAGRAVNDFNMAGKTLRDHGLYFCYHNHGFEFWPHGEGTLFDFIVQNTNAEYVSFEMDLLWTLLPGEDPVALLEKYPERFRLMHLKDLRKGVELGDLSGRTPVENDVVLGTGQIDFRSVLRAAKNTNIEYYYIEDESPDVINRVPESLEYITLKKVN